MERVPTWWGRAVALSGIEFTVIGVMPQAFVGLARPNALGGVSPRDGWIPAMMAPLGMVNEWRRTTMSVESPNSMIWAGVARLRPGYRLAEARAEAAVLGEQVKVLWPQMNGEAPVPFDPVPLDEDAVNPEIVHALLFLRVAGALVLALGGLNLANMFLARGIDRAKTFGLQTILGAPRLGLVWGGLTEALLVGAAGAAGGVLLTRFALVVLALLEPTILTSPFGVTFDPAGWQVDGSLALKALGLSGVAALFFGIVPAWRTTRVDASALLRGGAGITTGGLRWLRLTRPGGLLVVAEVSLALALTMPALLLVRSLGLLVTADLGFRAQGVTTAELNLPTDEYPLPTASSFVADVLDRLRQVPGVEMASWVSGAPLSKGFFTSLVKSNGTTTTGCVATVHSVAPDSFQTLGIPLKAGRDFARHDRADGPLVAILSAQGAKLLGKAVGSRVVVSALQGREVEVVNRGRRDLWRSRERTDSGRLRTSRPAASARRRVGRALVARAARPGSEPAGGAVGALDSRLRLPPMAALDQGVSRSLARFRGAAWLLCIAAGLALFLAGVGVYGLLASYVTGSIPEIGIRIALGAGPRSLGWLVARTALGLAAVGLVLGVGLGTWGARYVRSYLYGVQAFDTWTLLLTLVVAIVLALLAALEPAHRAMRVDPMVVLRCE